MKIKKIEERVNYRKDQFDNQHGRWHDELQLQKKCDPTREERRGKGLSDAQKYNIQVRDLIVKRSVQQKVAEFFVNSLFTTQTIFSLIDILFNDMKGDYTKYEESNKKAIVEAKEDLDLPLGPGEGKKEAANEQPQDEEMEEEGVGYSGWPSAIFDEQQYIELKQGLTIERVKDIIGEIMSACKSNEYVILEYIMKMVLFEKN